MLLVDGTHELMLTRLRAAVQRTCKFVLEGQLNVARVESGGFDETEPIFGCETFGLEGKSVSVLSL